MAFARIGLGTVAAVIAMGVATPSIAADGVPAGAEARYRAIAAVAKPGNVDADYALGLAAADAGHYAEAIIAFQRVLAVQPDHSRARAEIARAYALAGDIDTARSTFDTVINDPTVPDPVRTRIGKLVRDYDRAIDGGGRSITGYVEAEGGYDSNVNTATGLTSITLPVFAFLGPAALSGTATRMDDSYYQLQGGLSGVTGLSRQTRAYVSVLGSWRDHMDSGAFDQAALTGTAGVSHAMATGTVVSLSGQVQRFWLGHDGYRTAVGAIAQITRPVAGGRAISLQGQYFRFDYDNAAIRDADRIAMTATYTGRTWFAGVGGGRERTVRAGARNLGYWFAAGQLGTEYPLNERFALLAGGSVEHRNYAGADPLFLAGRRDTQVDGSLGVRFVAAKGLSVRPRVTYTRNFSNIALYDYSRVTASVGLRFEY